MARTANCGVAPDEYYLYWSRDDRLFMVTRGRRLPVRSTTYIVLVCIRQPRIALLCIDTLPGLRAGMHLQCHTSCRCRERGTWCTQHPRPTPVPCCWLGLDLRHLQAPARSLGQERSSRDAHGECIVATGPNHSLLRMDNYSYKYLYSYR